MRANAQAVKTQIVTFLCPSDINRLTADVGDGQYGWGKNNYKGNAGNDTGQWFRQHQHGAEQRHLRDESARATGASDRRYGSHTALFSEAMLGDGDDNHIEAPSDWFRISTADTTAAQVYAECTSLTPEAGAGNQFSRSGRNWVNGNYVVTRYNHVMPPNSRSCARCAAGTADLTTSANNQGGATTASSRHPGGVNLVMADASLQFVANGIDPKVWSALGSRTAANWSHGPGKEDWPLGQHCREIRHLGSLARQPRNRQLVNAWPRWSIIMDNEWLRGSQKRHKEEPGGARSEAGRPSQKSQNGQTLTAQ